jgi:hypothetical protein
MWKATGHSVQLPPSLWSKGLEKDPAGTARVGSSCPQAQPRRARRASPAEQWFEAGVGISF